MKKKKELTDKIIFAYDVIASATAGDTSTKTYERMMRALNWRVGKELVDVVIEGMYAS